MTTSTIIRFISALIVSVTLAALPARADNVSTGPFSISPGGLVPLGLPDRDVVRNPYNTLMGTAGSFSGLLPQTVGVVGPNLGLGVGFAPGLVFGGGGGGGSSSLGLTAPASLGAPAAPFAGSSPGSSGGTTSVVTTTGGLNAPAIVLPPGGGFSSSQSSTSSSNLVVVAQNVPEGGHSAILLGCGLLLASLFRRRMARSG